MEPKSVLQVRPRDSGTEQEILIKWRNLPAFKATWEPVEMIRQQFSDFHLEDKVDFGRGRNDRPPIQLTYARQGKSTRPKKQQPIQSN